MYSRDMQLFNVEQAIHEGYQTGRRLATAVDVEGQTRPSQVANQHPLQFDSDTCIEQMFMGATPITRKFFLFWEEFVDPSLNVPRESRIAYL